MAYFVEIDTEKWNVYAQCKHETIQRKPHSGKTEALKMKRINWN